MNKEEKDTTENDREDKFYQRKDIDEEQKKGGKKT